MKIFDYAGETFKFSTPNRTCLWRIDTILKKEPHMPKWIQTFKADEVFFDVGANIGQYSILAAKTRKCRVFSFEPDHSNYFILNRNIHLNEVSDTMQAYCVALGDERKYGKIGLSDLDFGFSGNDIRGPRKYTQGCFIDTLDNVSMQLGYPDHLKIDVDGVEPLIINGGLETLRNVMSMSIEFDLQNPSHIDTIDLIMSMSFEYDQEQVDISGKIRKGSNGFEHYRDYVFYKR